MVESAEQPLTIKLGATLLFRCYEFSQGRTEYQKGITQYLHNRHPGWRVTREMGLGIRAQALEDMAKLFSRGTGDRIHAPQSDRAIQESLDWEIGKMRTILNGPRLRPSRQERLPHRLLSQVTARDVFFLTRSKGRSRGEAVRNSGDISTDPRASHLQHYVIAGCSTDNPDFDQMFADLRAVYCRLQVAAPTASDRRLNQQIEQCLRLWRSYHPQAA